MFQKFGSGMGVWALSLALLTGTAAFLQGQSETAEGGKATEAVVPAGPKQPIAYSHQLHAGKLRMPCKSCHENKDPGEEMGIPATAKCMTCHTAVKTDSPEIQKLAQAHGASGKVNWVRVYQIPAYVFFSHRAHTAAGATCQDCHGPVAERQVLAREVEISMGACMDCHRKKQASLDCAFCHEARN